MVARKIYVMYEHEAVIATGTAEEVGRALGISPKTVRWYASSKKAHSNRWAVSYNAKATDIPKPKCVHKIGRFGTLATKKVRIKKLVRDGAVCYCKVCKRETDPCLLQKEAIKRAEYGWWRI